MKKYRKFGRNSYFRWCTLKLILPLCLTPLPIAFAHERKTTLRKLWKSTTKQPQEEESLAKEQDERDNPWEKVVRQVDGFVN